MLLEARISLAGNVCDSSRWVTVSNSNHLIIIYYKSTWYEYNSTVQYNHH